MSDSITTQGTLIQRGNGDGPPETFTAIGEVLDFDGPGGERGEIDVTHLQSTSREYKLALKDGGDMSFNVNILRGNAGQNGLQADHDANTLRNFKVILNDGGPTTASFAAFVKRFRRSGAKDDVVKGNVTLRISGDVTWT
jgi:hypothetical protein